MYLKHLVIENFKGHSHCELDFKPGFNLIIGDNGAGKTSALEAASVALGGYVVGIDDVVSRHFAKNEIRIVTTSMGEGSFHRQFETPVLVTCLAEIEGVEYRWTRRKSSVKASRSTVEPRTICRLANRTSRDPNGILPVLNYQSAARIWEQKREASENIFDTTFNRTVGYKNCLDEASDTKTLLNWCAKMEQVSWQKNKPISEYEAVKNALSCFMSAMDEGHVSRIQFDKQNLELSYIDNGISLPVRCLSAGYQSVIWMVLDIAYRMAVLNPNLCERAAESTGIILIDELDMHLHPKWQWNVIGALQKTFPNVQFIAATHSPILIASCKDGHLIYMDQDTVSYGITDYGMEVNDVLTYTQGSSAMVKCVKKQMDEFYALTESGKLETAEQKFHELEQLLGKGHAELNRARTALDFEKAILEDGE